MVKVSKILIVDDEKDLASLLKEVLKIEGYDVYMAIDYASALEWANKITFDIALIDIRLPGMNGVELFLKLKELHPFIKVIMMTGFAVEKLIEKAFTEGAYGCLHKPFNLSNVIDVIKKILLNNKVILIVDDEAEIRDSLNEILMVEGYHALVAEDGEKALAALKNNNIHLIILNFHLPGMDGLSFFREARKINKHIKVLLITGYDLQSILQREETKWLYGYMKKPIDFKILLNLISKAV